MNLPEAFIERTKHLLGDEYDLFEKALNEPSPISVRMNNKMNYEPSADKIDWCEDGFYLSERPLFTADPFFHAGVYYVQEASSMFLHRIGKEYLQDSKIILDLCAAPGGKSTLLSQVINKNSLLVSNEIISSRANILSENMIKWGNPNVLVTSNKPKDFSRFKHYFDAIVIDAPCSGEGMFRKDKEAINEWSEQNVFMCAQRQKDILTDVWDSLKPNGVLIYSTCTYNREENENNVEWICENLDAEVLKVSGSISDGIIEDDFGYRFYPHKVRGEGFFISVLRKKCDDVVSDLNKRKKANKKGIVTYKSIMPLNLKNLGFYEIIQDSNKVFAYSHLLLNDYLLLKENLKVIYSGIELGEIKGKDFIPSISIALSKELNIQSINRIDVDYDTAINYLRKEAVYLPDAEKGYNLIVYKGQPLGWVKNIGNRWNNLYPSEWRIRMRI